MGFLYDVLSQWKGDLEREIARWNEDPFAVVMQGDPMPRSPWSVILEETGQEFIGEAGESNMRQTAVNVRFEITWTCPADKMDRFLFHSSPDEDGLQRAIWNLRWEDNLPTALGDSEVEMGEWELPEDHAPLPVAIRRMTLTMGVNFVDSRSHPIVSE